MPQGVRMSFFRVSVTSTLTRLAISSIGLLLCIGNLSVAPAGELPATLRRPIAMALSTDEAYLYVAHRNTGSISVIDVARRKVITEVPIGQQLSDLQHITDSLLVATDEARHQLLMISTDGQKLKVQHRVSTPPYPVRIATSADGSTCYVSCLWPRQLARIKLTAEGSQPPRCEQITNLPLAPRDLLLLEPEQRLIVADSFAGRLAVVDTQTQQVQHVSEFPGHNVRGIALSDDRKMLIIAHQMLNELGHTVRNDVHWGLVMSNDLRWLQLERVLSNSDDLYRGGQMHPLGEAGKAMGDPTNLAVAGDGTVVVTLGGVAEVALGKQQDFSMGRTPVGLRPSAVLITAESQVAYVSNMYDDSISIVDLASRQMSAVISLGPQRPLTVAERGELLFHDARLSHDNWMSCHSCHTDGHTNGMLNDNFNDQSFGAPKRVMSLLGHADTAPFRWNGSAKDLHQQIRDSVKNTMQADRDLAEQEIDALVAYLRTLPAPPPIDLMRGERNAALVNAGQRVFESRQCTNCHQPQSYTTPDVYDVGIVDQLGKKRFNPPSLIGVGQRGPYFHDNRAATLKDVFVRHRHQIERDFTPKDLQALLAFLRDL